MIPVGLCGFPWSNSDEFLSCEIRDLYVMRPVIDCKDVVWRYVCGIAVAVLNGLCS